MEPDHSDRKQNARSGGTCHVYDLTTLEVFVLLSVKRLGRMAYGIAIAEMMALHAKGIERGRVPPLLRALRESGMLSMSEDPPRGGRSKTVYALTERGKKAVERILLVEAELTMEPRK
jgi:DNA-binding PadR family transcriptional regulator